MGDVAEPDIAAQAIVPPDTGALLRTVFDAPGITAGVWEDIGDDYRYVLANRNACEGYGLPEGGLDGKTGRDTGASQQGIDDRLRLMRACHANQRSYTLEMPFTPPGQYRRNWVRGTYAALPPTPGAGPRTSFVVFNITDRKEAELEAARQRERLEVALNATGLGLWEYDIVTGQLSWDARTRELFGVGAEAPVTFEVYQAHLHPEDAAEQTAAYQAALKGENGGAYVREHRTVGDDGRVRWVEGAGRVVFEDGRPARVLGTLRDIDDTVMARERQGLLLAELNHRVKNSLATVQALAQHTMRSTPEPERFREAFEARLASLAGAHDLLTQSAWETAEFAAVVKKALQPFPQSAFRLEGPEAGVKVRPDLAVSLTLLIHELATNAAKYGALSLSGGLVTLTWRGSDGGLELHWSECGGPPVEAPSRSGFGARLIRRSITGLGGETHLDYAREGLRARFRAPLSAGVIID
jgi:PAS domain S-box-containing protein